MSEQQLGPYREVLSKLRENKADRIALLSRMYRQQVANIGLAGKSPSEQELVAIDNRLLSKSLELATAEQNEVNPEWVKLLTAYYYVRSITRYNAISLFQFGLM